jgi:prepilin-type N-terminal cleavage/methylation domain-containing protein
MKNRKGFTFIETMIVIGIIAILATAVVVTVNPTRRFEAARDKQREIHLQTIYNAIERKMTVEGGWFDDENCDPLPQATSTEVVDGKEVELPLFKTIGTATTTDDTYYNLFSCLVPKYMVNPLFDPAEGSEEDTKYQIWQNPQTKYVTLRYVKKEGEPIVAGAQKYGILNVPTVTTASTTKITHTSAEGGGNVTSDGGASVFERGVIWGKDEARLKFDYVDMANVFRSSDGSKTGSFTSVIHSLVGNTQYYVCAYARNDVGVGYGDVRMFSTPDLRPVVETLPEEHVTNNTAVLQGEILTLGIAPVTAYFCKGESVPSGDTCPENQKKSADEPGAGAITKEPFSFSVLLTGLATNQPYSFKACGHNTSGDRCGDVKSFTPTESVPYVETIYPATNITAISAIAWGDVVSDGGLDILERGICYSQSEDPKYENWDDVFVFCKPAAGGEGEFSASITDLNPNTTYDFRAYAKNDKGLSHGEREQFTTLKTPPVVTTVGTSNVKSSSASASGKIDNDGGEIVINHGICWLPYPRDPQTDSATKNDPKNSTYCTKDGQIGKNVPFTHDISVSSNGLWGNTKYNIRAYAINIKGTGWGNMVDFTTQPPTNPTLTTIEPPTDITMTSAKLKGNITDHGGAKISGTSGSFRICYSLSTSNTDPKIGGQGVIGCPSLLLTSNLGEFTIEVTGLIPSTSYHYQAYVKNEAGLYTYGGAKSFETSASEPPTVETIRVDDSGSNWAKIKGQVKTTGGYSDTKRGICYKTLESDAVCFEDTGTGVGEFWVTTPSELELGITYYAFAFAYNNPEEKVYDETPIEFKLKICQKYVNGSRVNIDDGQDPFEQCPDTMACDGACVRKGNPGYCFQGACKGEITETPPTDGYVCNSATKKWEPIANKTNYCKIVNECTEGSCTGYRRYQGCKAKTTTNECTSIGQTSETVLAPAGYYITSNCEVTLGKIIVYMSTASTQGNFGGRNGADTFCTTNKPTTLTDISKIHALLCVNGSDSVANMPGNWGYFSDIPLYWYHVPEGTLYQFAYSWGYFVGNNSILKSPADGTGVNATYWTGCNQNGTTIYYSGYWTCNSWTSNNNWQGICFRDVSTVGDPTATGCGYYLRKLNQNQGAACKFAGSYCDWVNYCENTSCNGNHRLLCASEKACHY